MNNLQRTWSGQPAELAWHWNEDTYQKLGKVVFLVSKGDSYSRTKAYHDFIEIKRWFVEVEFEECIGKLDDLREVNGAKPLREIIIEIYREMLPATEWKAKIGVNYSNFMPPLNALIPEEKQLPNGKFPVYNPDQKQTPEPAKEFLKSCTKIEVVEQISLSL